MRKASTGKIRKTLLKDPVIRTRENHQRS